FFILDEVAKCDRFFDSQNKHLLSGNCNIFYLQFQEFFNRTNIPDLCFDKAITALFLTKILSISQWN
ncbi:MAG: hypothetical protein AAFR62_21640, partial [Cyanobacteria bacterium J06629_2]